MRLHLPRKKLWIAALKLQRWPVTWWDEAVEKRRNWVRDRPNRANSTEPGRRIRRGKRVYCYSG